MNQPALYLKAVSLLKDLILIPSFSKEEGKTADLLEQWLQAEGVAVQRLEHNVWATNLHFDASKPTILLNSHHDTVKPNKGYTRDPFSADEAEGKLFGLGSNDAGGALVSLIALFLHFYKEKNLAWNLVLAATAEEEISGTKGIELLYSHLPEISFALVGEPTGMQMAIAEKGLLVLDAYASGKAGHAAHDNIINAIYEAMQDIAWIRQFAFPRVSPLLGKVKMSVTQIDAGTQHNVVPDRCHFVVDVRVNDQYSNREVFEIIDSHTKSEIIARSFRLNASSIPEEHPFVQAGKQLGCSLYGSPTLSDQALLPCPSLKMGPGDSRRSHQADEFIYLNELEAGIALYLRLFESFLR
ncbi:MAG: M20 family metallo-hydrolase [Lewinellaceae bacterium]|nr:M20 family metallo-hydrolase [Lewinellaceae bacterium]